MSPPPDHTHDDIVSRLVRLITLELLRLGARGKLLSPRAAIWTSDRTYLEPDLFYLSSETEARLDPNRRTTADLVIEVISPGSAIYDQNTKTDTYAALGVKELWLIDETKQIVELRTLKASTYDEGQGLAKGERLECKVIPGVNIGVTKIFED